MPPRSKVYSEQISKEREHAVYLDRGGSKMILADKIIENRKKNGWSQEELANRLGVSRQSVSKWESAQAVPDLKKILQLAEVFGVTTDYLIKDEIEETQALEPAPVDKGLEETVRSVSMEEASAFLEYNETSSRLISTGVMACILSPVVLILLAGTRADRDGCERSRGSRNSSPSDHSRRCSGRFHPGRDARKEI